MLLVVTYSKPARQTLRNVCRTHEDTVVRRFGRAALFEATAFGAFLAVRMRERHGVDVQIERTEPFDARVDAPEDIHEAAAAYEDRDAKSTPYHKFAAGTDHPDPETMRDREL